MTASPEGTPSRRPTSRAASRIGDSSLAKRLSREIEGTVLFDAFSRGRYSTDASIYQIEPIGVVVPRSEEDVIRVIQIAAEERIPVLPRGGGTSQCGQTVGEALVVDVSKHLNTIVDFSESERRATVQPGLVLDQLNAFLRPRGLMFPVDPSTSSRATIGGMAGNNSCGSRSIRYGLMRDNVRAIDAILATGEKLHFGEIAQPVEAVEGGNHPLI
ncbi:MAG: FAD-binding oxidoreductase, partial [Alphaproteobacteria bacterium]